MTNGNGSRDASGPGSSSDAGSELRIRSDDLHHHIGGLLARELRTTRPSVGSDRGDESRHLHLTARMGQRPAFVESTHRRADAPHQEGHVYWPKGGRNQGTSQGGCGCASLDGATWNDRLVHPRVLCWMRPAVGWRGDSDPGTPKHPVDFAARRGCLVLRGCGALRGLCTVHGSPMLSLLRREEKQRIPPGIMS